MKQKFFSLADSFTIKDENEQDRYQVAGKFFSIGKKFVFKDMQGHELARIEQKLFALGRTFFIYRQNELAATVKKSLWSWFGARFTIDVPGPADMEVAGNFVDREYRFTRNGETVATVSKKFFSWTDTYGIDVADGEDDVLILASVVVIDMCCHEKR